VNEPDDLPSDSAPMSTGERIEAGQSLHRAGRLAQAERLYREVLRENPDNPDALHLLGVVAMQVGKPEASVKLIADAIEAQPDIAAFHANLGRAWQSLGQTEKACNALQRALQLAPGAAEFRSALGVVLQNAGDLDAAIAQYHHVLRDDPGDHGTLYNLGTALKQAGDLEQAIQVLWQAHRIDEGHPQASPALAGYLLEQGDIRDALTVCDQCLARNPRVQYAVTFKAIALHRLGDPVGAHYLLDYETLIRAFRPKPPPDFGNLEDFNAALARHVCEHPTLEYERSENATRNGRHTGDLLAEPAGPVRPLTRTLGGAVHQYLNELPFDRDHAFLGRRHEHWRLNIWGVVMDTMGHQLPHVHPDGWISGCYYVQVPRVVRSDDHKQAGWIEFGQPPPELEGTEPVPTWTYRPESGTVVLFPSYLYHRTVPFRGDEQRISIAFDLIPIAAAP